MTAVDQCVRWFGRRERIGSSAQSGDVLVIDWAADAHNGVALVDVLREKHPELRVLYTAGYSDESPASGSPLPAGSAVWQKPFSADSPGRKIRRLLE